MRNSAPDLRICPYRGNPSRRFTRRLTGLLHSLPAWTGLQGIMAVLTLVSVVVSAAAREDARRAVAAAAGAALEAKKANKISKDANALASTANQVAKTQRTTRRLPD